MARLQIQDVDAGIMRNVKAAAAMQGITLRDYVLGALRLRLEAGGELQGNSGGVAENGSGKGETVPGTERPRKASGRVPSGRRELEYVRESEE